MNSREQFEEWFADHAGQSVEWVKNQRASDTHYKIGPEIQRFWLTWQASREALEQQDVMSVPAYHIVYHPNPDPNEYDDKEHSHCGSIHLARRLATEIGGTIRPVYIGEQQQPQTDTYQQIENDGREG